MLGEAYKYKEGSVDVFTYEQSEVLTRNGWKRFKDVCDSDRIMSLNPETRELEWVSIVDRQCYEHSGKMVHFYNKSLDCLVTPEHRMPYIRAETGQISYSIASEYNPILGSFIGGEKQFAKEIIPYSGKVYDLTLERNHIMYIRRNGKCFWGSNCMCYCIPILKTEDEFWSDDDAKSVNEVTDVPKGFKDWVEKNAERISAAKERGKLPYFIADNRKVVMRIQEGEGSGSKSKDGISASEAARIEANRRQYERLKADPNYTDVEFNPENGGLKAKHVEHNLDGNKGWYEEHVQMTGYKNGHSVILGKEIHTIKNKRNVEGLFDNQSFEIAGAETGIANNIRNALKHCASKPGCKVAVVFFPYENNVEMAKIRDGLRKYFGLRGDPNQFQDFDHIYFMTAKRIIYHQKKQGG